MKSLLFLFVLSASLQASAQEVESKKPAPKKKVSTIQPSSEQKRLDYLSKASIWTPQNIESLDLIAGPPINGAFQFDEKIECQFSKSGREASRGSSRKFQCTDQNRKQLRVKYSITDEDLSYFSGLTVTDKKGKVRPALTTEQISVIEGQHNKEVFAEVATTRFFWALGYTVDTMYPTQVKCIGCPIDPMEGTLPILESPLAFVARYSASEIKVPGIELAMKPDQGWKWEELEQAAGPFPAPGEEPNKRVQYEALKLLAAFVQHGDRKAEQQRLSCPPENLTSSDLNPDKDGIVTENESESLCSAPIAYIHDLGATFGGAGKTSNGKTAKMSLKHWAEKTIFYEDIYQQTLKVRKGVKNGVCRADMGVSMSASGGMGEPLIREEGRAFLADLLIRFRDSGKVKDLFRVARVQGLGDTVEAWEQVFLSKMDQILSHSCCVPTEKGDKCVGDR